MTNEELELSVKPLLEELTDLNECAMEIAKALIGETLFKTDLYFCALLNKSVQLTDGFIELIGQRNLTCAGILLRANMDNCLRLFAMYISENPEQLVDCIIKGEKIDKLKDKSGKQLKDWYLKEQLGKYDSRIVDVYNNASGYVHFSEKGFFQSVGVASENTISIQVSHLLPEKANEYVLECVDVYIYYLKLFYSLFTDIIRMKEEYDNEH